MPAMLKKKPKLLVIPFFLAAFFIIGGVAFAGIGKNTYYAQRLDQWEKAVKENPDDYNAVENLGKAYYKAGEYEKAIEAYTKALRITPTPAYIVRDRGLAYMQIKEFGRAIVDFTKAIQLAPQEKDFVAQCLNERAVAYYLNGQYQNSIEDVNMAIKLGYKVHPDFIAALKDKGFNITEE